VKGKATRHISGSGLGLALVKEVVEAHQGYIEVDSEPGSGTRFTLSFPLVSVL
jgi:signal transduction histidine kinase